MRRRTGGGLGEEEKWKEEGKWRNNKTKTINVGEEEEVNGEEEK
jgi:hypothetical protein